jgi:hypothetical protein
MVADDGLRRPAHCGKKGPGFACFIEVGRSDSRRPPPCPSNLMIHINKKR